MKVWELFLNWGENEFYNKLFREDNPPSINRIGEVLYDWGVNRYGVQEVIEAFTRGGNSHVFGWCTVILREVEVE